MPDVKKSMTHEINENDETISQRLVGLKSGSQQQLVNFNIVQRNR